MDQDFQKLPLYLSHIKISMTRSILFSIIFHSVMIVLTALSLPFMMREPIDLPPVLSVDLIQITDTTSIPFAAKAAKTL